MYLLSLGCHDVQLVNLGLQGLILDPQILFRSCITHFHKAVLHLRLRQAMLQKLKDFQYDITFLRYQYNGIWLVSAHIH